jgi:hypothetical protein
MRAPVAAVLTGVAFTAMATFPSFAEDIVGSICIAPLPEKVEEADRMAFAGGPRRRYKYEFTVEFDERVAVPVQKTKPVAVEALELTRKHRVRIRDAGRLIESFRFTFAERGGFPLCLAYTAGYQTWSLERARPSQKWCECQASSHGPSNYELQRTRPAQATEPRR